MKRPAFFFLLLLLAGTTCAEDGYRLWLRYDLVADTSLLQEYREQINSCRFETAGSAILQAARQELMTGLAGLLGRPARQTSDESPQPGDGALIVGTPSSSPIIAMLHWTDTLVRLGDEGFLIRPFTLNGKHGIAIAAASDKGVLYAVFRFLRLLQTQQSLRHLDIVSVP